MVTDRKLRGAIFIVAILLGSGTVLLQDSLPDRARATIGLVCFLAMIVACSSNIRAIRWRTVWCGLGLQLALALLILRFEVFGLRPGYEFFSGLAAVVNGFLEFTRAGSEFVFGVLANQNEMGQVFPNGLVLAFAALPTIIFVSSVFTVLHYLGVIQVLVGLMARVMAPLMRTSGAETLSAAANVFMGQTEAPIIVKPYIQDMTESELLALMTGGLATIAGSVLAVYISLGADPVAILTTSVMAAPCGLYLSKILIPEIKFPDTGIGLRVPVGKGHVNLIDAAAAGAAEGMRLAINVAAVLIAFLGLIAMIDFLLGLINPNLSLAGVFATLFAPVAVLLGVTVSDVPAIADLLGIKLVTNEFVAYVKLSSDYQGVITERSHVLATFALTGFANFGSVGILLGGIGGMAPSRRADLARLSSRALLAGFVATLINAAIAAIVI